MQYEPAFYSVVAGIIAALCVLLWAASLTIMDWIKDRHKKKLAESRKVVGWITKVYHDGDGLHAEIRTKPGEEINVAGLLPGVSYQFRQTPVHEGVDFGIVKLPDADTLPTIHDALLREYSPEETLENIQKARERYEAAHGGPPSIYYPNPAYLEGSIEVTATKKPTDLLPD